MCLWYKRPFLCLHSSGMERSIQQPSEAKSPTPVVYMQTQTLLQDFLLTYQHLYLFWGIGLKKKQNKKSTLKSTFCSRSLCFYISVFWLCCNLSRRVKLHLTGGYSGPTNRTNQPPPPPMPPCRRQSHEGD